MKVDLAYTGNIDPDSMIEDAREARRILETGSGKGSHMRGWLDLPRRTTEKDLTALADAAREILPPHSPPNAATTRLADWPIGATIGVRS